MIKGLEAILLFSENAKQLADFYQDKVGLKKTEEMDIGEHGEKGFEFAFDQGSNLYILDHSKVKGNNLQPERIMFNFEVDNIESEVEKLKDAGAKLVQEIYEVGEYGRIATFEDIDGNYFQLVQAKAS